MVYDLVNNFAIILLACFFFYQTAHKLLTELFGNKNLDGLTVSHKIKQFCFKVIYECPRKVAIYCRFTLLITSLLFESFDNDLFYEKENRVDYVIAASNNLLQKIRDKLLSNHVCL